MNIIYSGAPRKAVESAVESVSYLHGWFIRLGDDWLQVVFPGEDSKTGSPALQYGRKWRLSPHMTRGEIIQTLFAAIGMAEEHERREHFRYRGVAIFGPHHDLDALADFVSKTPEDLRDD